ncbi:coenzyme PQQ synthesis protein B [Labrys miyagiensis]|uniref:Coenzyme PQQ synthesis protein B n=1 Tax=Labrys miyagiensis TaxID=346912 RepID=A0ABQ6CRM1_9HYPH|nr:coenzyme PQQ synthesis protein B [Labrys miyagiensis]
MLVDASPDIRQQIMDTPVLRPIDNIRHSPIAAVLVTSGEVDHIAGLLGLRERHSFSLFGTTDTLDTIEQNAIFGVIGKDLVTREAVKVDHSFTPVPGLEVTLVPVPGKVPLWREDEPLRLGEETESTVGVAISAAGKRIVYAPGCAASSTRLRETIAGADLLLFDGTFWKDDEMITSGAGSKTGRRMGHMPMSGPDGSMMALADISIGRRVFIHINNTNLALVEDSAERAAVDAAGWTLAYDGMTFAL